MEPRDKKETEFFFFSSLLFKDERRVKTRKDGPRLRVDDADVGKSLWGRVNFSMFYERKRRERPISSRLSLPLHLFIQHIPDWRAGSKSLDTYLAVACSSLLIRMRELHRFRPPLLNNTHFPAAEGIKNNCEGWPPIGIEGTFLLNCSQLAD